MTTDQFITDAGAIIGAIGVICAVLAHLPFSPKWAERFARFAVYAANAKFSINQRNAPPPPRVEEPKDDDKTPPRMFPPDSPTPTDVAPLLIIAFAVGFAVSNLTACATSKPPCDQAKIAGIVAICTARSQQCVNEGKSEAECSSLNECDDEIDRACGVTK